MAIKITGRERLRAVLAKLPKTAKAELQKAMNEGGEKIVARQKSLVQVKSGTLRDSIRYEPFSRGGIGVVIRAGGPTTTKPVRQGQSATYDYAMGQELGTQEMLAQPFFYPGYRHTKTVVKRRASKAVRLAVEAAMK